MNAANRLAGAAVVTMALGLVSAYGLAQPKPGTPGPKPAAAANPDAGAAHRHHGQDCSCPGGKCSDARDCGACAKGGDAGAACAGACGHCGAAAGPMQCPMTGLAALADVKVEKTKAGATLQLIAKEPGKAAEVQALAEKMAEHMKAGGCPMDKSGHGMMHGHHGGTPAPQGAAPASTGPKK